MPAQKKDLGLSRHAGRHARYHLGMFSIVWGIVALLPAVLLLVAHMSAPEPVGNSDCPDCLSIKVDVFPLIAWLWFVGIFAVGTGSLLRWWYSPRRRIPPSPDA